MCGNIYYQEGATGNNGIFELCNTIRYKSRSPLHSLPSNWEEENLHPDIASKSSRRLPSSGSRTACQKAGLSPLPPWAPCTSPVHLPATLFGLVHPGGGRPRSPRRVGGRPSLHVGSLLQSPSIFSSPPSREGLKMTPPLGTFPKNHLIW